MQRLAGSLRKVRAAFEADHTGHDGEQLAYVLEVEVGSVLARQLEQQHQQQYISSTGISRGIGSSLWAPTMTAHDIQ